MQVILSLIVILIVNTDVFSQITGCPSIDLGPDTSITCSTPCLTLEATVLEVGQTNTYSVSSLPYAPPYPYTQGTPILVNLDDVWSEEIALPFNFCFFGNIYDKIVVGANGVISFDITLASPAGCNWFTCTFCEWAFSQSMPNTNGFPYRNSINGAYHDIDPSIAGSIRYAILGSYPCRTFVVNYESIPHFLCNNITTTQQIVIYETTNIIEVFIQDKPTCSTWNNGNAVIGIQNANGTTAFYPPNRNTGPWSTSNEAWRFTPDGTSAYSIQWFDNSGSLIGTGDTINVCPTASTAYSADVTYNRCDGTQIVETDQVNVTIAGGGLPTVVANANTISICTGDAVILTGSGAVT
jgi:hypothetical protein